ncbi:hypothetical protein GAYE_SCF07G2971 [Galdieria yellowstonensis]|uniref:ACT domain-containing protein n=1 Tax=Galdieria yellowstonensis TaxID=3028027 RepID=A0AAV9ID46_9RHOD|nr:hypothetical protein GAYE_SCF07G2971 [Galdieria yellowstonensis]
MAFRQLSRYLWCKNIRPLFAAPLTTSHMLYATKNSWLAIPSGCTLLCRSAFTHGSIAAASESDPSTAPMSKNKKATNMETQSFVVSVTGSDRVGIVHDFSWALKNISANVESSRMACLGGDFAMIVLVSLNKKDGRLIQSTLESALPGFQISTRPASTVVERHVSPDVREYELYVEGPDSEGIVEAVTGVLAKKGANIVELETETVPAPFAGFTLFRMGSRVAFPFPLYQELMTALSRVEEEFGVDIDLEEVVEEDEEEDSDDENSFGPSKDHHPTRR